MASSVLSFLGWTFLPDLVTSAIQGLYYSITVRAGDPKPKAGTPKHALHNRRIQIGVTLIYLFYSLYESYWDITRAGDFYSRLGVSPASDDRTIQSKFRRLTLLYHPDKVSSSTPRAEAETYYISLQTARDVLLSAPQRYAYDRFGPQSLDWKAKKTIAEYVTHGLQYAILPFYGGSGVVLLCLGYMGMLNYGTYWRYLAFLAMAAFELRTVTGLAPPLPCVIIPATIRRLAALLQSVGLPASAAKSLASYAPQPFLPFQVLEFFHSATVTIFLAVSRLGPLLEVHYDPSKAAAEGSGSEDAKMSKLVTRLETAVAMGNAEVSRQLALEAVPVSGDGSGAVMDSSLVLMQGGGGGGGESVDKNKNQTQNQKQATSSSQQQKSEKQQQQQQFIGGGVGGSGAGSGLATLRDEVKDWLINNTIRNDPQVSAAVSRVIARRAGNRLEAETS